VIGVIDHSGLPSGAGKTLRRSLHRHPAISAPPGGMGHPVRAELVLPIVSPRRTQSSTRSPTLKSRVVSRRRDCRVPSPARVLSGCPQIFFGGSPKLGGRRRSRRTSHGVHLQDCSLNMTTPGPSSMVRDLSQPVQKLPVICLDQAQRLVGLGKGEDLSVPERPTPLPYPRRLAVALSTADELQEGTSASGPRVQEANHHASIDSLGCSRMAPPRGAVDRVANIPDSLRPEQTGPITSKKRSSPTRRE